MSKRALTLPLRASRPRPQWICRRCMATQPETYAPPPIDPLPPAADGPGQDHLNKMNSLLSRRLPHRIHPQYLMHSTSDKLNAAAKAERDAHIEKHKDIRGVVVSAGLMDKTVRVRVPGKRWNKKIGKVCASKRVIHGKRSAYKSRSSMRATPNTSCTIPTNP